MTPIAACFAVLNYSGAHWFETEGFEARIDKD
jgi:hypothetical protein